MVPIKSINADYAINVPTSRKEFTPELFEQLTKHIHLANNYAVLAIVHKVKLWEIAASINTTAKGKDVPASVIILLAKANGELPGKVGDKVCISRTDLEMGLHLNGISHISVEGVRSYIGSDDALCKAIINRSTLGNTDYIYLLEFKIVGFNSIKAIIDSESSSINNDPFVIIKDVE